MRRQLLFGAGIVIAVLVGVYLLRSSANREVGEAVDNGLSQLIALLPPGYAASRGATQFNPLTNTLTVHDLVVSHAGTRLWTAETVVLTDTSPQALRDVFDPTAYPDGHPPWTDTRGLIGHADITGLTETPPGADQLVLRIRHATIDQLRGRPFALPPTPENRQTQAFAIDAAKALAVGGLDIEDVDVLIPAKDGGHVVVAGLNLQGYAAGKLDQAALDGLAIDGQARDEKSGTTKPVHVAMARLAGRAIDASRALARFDPSAPESRDLDDLRIGSADLESFEASIGSGPKFALASFTGSTDYKETGDAMSRGAIKAMQLAIGDMPLAPAQKHTLEVFGKDAFELDIDGGSQWQQAPRRVIIDQETLAFRGLGTLHLSASLSDLPPGSPQSNPAAWMGLKIEKASLAWDDASLANRLIAVAADSSHTSPDTMRQQLAMPLAMLSPMIPDQPDAADQVSAFLKNPHHLAITLTPPQPVTVGQVLASPMPGRAHLLGLHVVGN